MNEYTERFRELSRDTLRDRVWKVLIELSDTLESGSEIRRDWVFADSIMNSDEITAHPRGRFTKHDVAQRVDVSERTIQDVLETAVSYGLLESDIIEATLSIENQKPHDNRAGVRGYRPPELGDSSGAVSAADNTNTNTDTDTDTSEIHASEVAALKSETQRE